MYTLALAAGSLLGENGKPRVEQILALANRISESNPDYRAYQIGERSKGCTDEEGNLGVKAVTI